MEQWKVRCACRRGIANDAGVYFRTDDQFSHFATNANAEALEMADIYAFADANLKVPRP